MNKERIKGRIYVVTGAGSGIGRLTACHLVDAGAIVYGVSRKIPEPYTAGTGKFIPMRMDVTDEGSVTSAAEKIRAAGTVYGVINCAGSGLAGALEDCTPEEVLKQFDVLAVGALRVSQAFMPDMREHHEGVIINIGSIGGDFPLPYQGTYSMAKAALRKETEVLRMEMKRFGIEACVIEPGDMKTGFTAARTLAEKTDGSVHEEAVKRAVEEMAHDEMTGADPVEAADLVMKLLRKKKLPACVPVGGVYVVFPFLNRIFPYSLVEKIICSMYHV